jgi:hypothetical protein
VAVNAKQGLVVFDSLWCPRVAKRFRERIETEFGRKDVSLVVLTHGRLDLTGGGSVYPGARILALRECGEVLARQKGRIDLYLKPLVDMWRLKEESARRRLSESAPGSRGERQERAWMAFCRGMADDLSEGYDLILPTATFSERLSVDLGDMTLELADAGAAARGTPGLVARIPEIGLVVFGKFLFRDQHLLPYLNTLPWQELRIARLLAVLDVILAEEGKITDLVVSSGPWPLAEIKARRRYLGELWAAAETSAKQGAGLEQLQKELSLEGRFAWLTDLPVWKNQGADWVREEHQANVARVWGQFQRFAAREILEACRASGTAAAVSAYRKLQEGKDSKLIFDETSLHSLVDILFLDGYLEAADAVSGLNVASFPGSWRVHDRRGQMCLANGRPGEALAAYRKSLELNPSNENARAMIRKLAAP